MEINEQKLEPSLVGKIRKVKNICLLTGIFMLVINFATKEYFKNSSKTEIKKHYSNYNPYNQPLEERLRDEKYFKVISIESRFDDYILYLNIFNIILAFALYTFVSKYDKMFWSAFIVLLMMAFPNVMLILAGLKIILKEEYKSLF